MRTTEFIETVEELGFAVIEDQGMMRVCKESMFPGRGYVTVAEVYDNLYALHVVRSSMVTGKLFDVLAEYADTDVDEREEPVTLGDMLEMREKLVSVSKEAMVLLQELYKEGTE